MTEPQASKRTAEDRQRAGGSICFESASITLGGREILSGLSCQVPAGEITVILGMSGAGKSVMMRLALGLMQPDSGRVLVDGLDLARTPRHALTALRRQFGVAFQGGALFTALDVAENISFPLREHTNLGDDDIDARVAELLRRVDLPGKGALRIDELSGGMLKRVAFARALALHPRVVFLDEPSSGLDPIIAARIDEVILKLHADHPATYFVITHDLPSAQRIADHVGLLHAGKLAIFEPAADFWSSSDPRVRQLLERQPDGPITPLEEREVDAATAPAAQTGKQSAPANTQASSETPA